MPSWVVVVIEATAAAYGVTKKDHIIFQTNQPKEESREWGGRESRTHTQEEGGNFSYCGGHFFSLKPGFFPSLLKSVCLESDGHKEKLADLMSLIVDENQKKNCVMLRGSRRGRSCLAGLKVWASQGCPDHILLHST